MKPLLEIACFDVESALLAQEAGADRIEFCRDYAAGGLSPSSEDIRYLLPRLRIPLHVMVRPRAGDFVYSALEFNTMQKEVERFKSLGVQGLVFGALTRQGLVDLEKTKHLVSVAWPLPCCFHRAVDLCKDPIEAVRTLTDTGVQWVLSSGGKPNAEEGKVVLAAMQAAAGFTLSVMPGGGIREKNLLSIQSAGEFKAIHSAAYDVEQGVVIPEEIKAMKHLLQLS